MGYHWVSWSHLIAKDEKILSCFENIEKKVKADLRFAQKAKINKIQLYENQLTIVKIYLVLFCSPKRDKYVIKKN